MDAPIPGIEPWSEILLNPGVWHFHFHGPDAERLVAGRERIYFDRIWNDFTADPSKPDEATRNFFAATYAQPGGMRAGFAQFTAFSQDAKDNKIFEQVKLTMPVLAVGGEKSFGPLQAVIMRHVATNVREAVVAGSGHWLMEERPAESVALIRNFLDISGDSNEGQEVQSSQAENSKPPVKSEQRGRIVGIGGVFFKSANRDQMREWYSTHLGLADQGRGAMLRWREHDDPQQKHVTVWTIFPASTKYFDPSPAPFMIDYIVDDMDALLDRLKREGVKIDGKRMDASFGRFAWIYDSDGNKIELWQPLAAKP
jgi:catechol 2,3-dioxygenase-like lactoylglutathione lyase family enzyme